MNVKAAGRFLPLIHSLGLGLVVWVWPAGATPTPDPEATPLPTWIAQNPSSDLEPLVVALTVGGRQLGVITVYQTEAGLLVPFDTLTQTLDLRIQEDGDQVLIRTPLGEITLAAERLQPLAGERYIASQLLVDYLMIQPQFESSTLTLALDVPWRIGSGVRAGVDPELTPDVGPPAAGIASLEQRLSYTREDQTSDSSATASTVLKGRVLGGSARLRIESRSFDPGPSDIEFAEYFLRFQQNQTSYLVGRQSIRLHPLLDNLDVVGAQIGWTNLDLDLFRRDGQASTLYPRQSRTIRSFTGEAIPAGLVELRLNGRIIATQQVGLDGLYTFNDVNLPSGQQSVVEILIYDRSNLTVPVDIQEQRFQLDELLLPSGGTTQVAGVGVGQDQPIIQNEAVGFYQVRHGLADNLTLEASLLTTNEGSQAHSGMIWGLADNFVAGIGVATSNDEVSYSVALDGQINKLDVRALAELIPESFSDIGTTGEERDNSLRLTYPVADNLRLEVVARDRQDSSGDEFQYVLPGVDWRLGQMFSFRARPDLEGIYQINSLLKVTDDLRLSVDASESTLTSVQYDFTPRTNLNVSGLFGDFESRYTAVVNHRGQSIGDPSFRLGAFLEEGSVGPAIGSTFQVVPGILASVDYGRASIDGNNRLTVRVSGAASFASTGIVPGQTDVNEREGAIAGRLQLEAPEGLMDPDLGRITVSVNDGEGMGRTATTDNQGTFTISNLKEGIYRVNLDSTNLPIELSPLESSVVAEVAAGVVTGVTFVVRPEYGIAGQITDESGQPIPGIPIELLDDDGSVKTSAFTDNFGYYRIDGIPVGDYSVRVAPDALPDRSLIAVQRPIQISSDFIFGQDLQLPVFLTKDEIEALSYAGP